MKASYFGVFCKIKKMKKKTNKLLESVKLQIVGLWDPVANVQYWKKKILLTYFLGLLTFMVAETSFNFSIERSNIKWIHEL